MLRTAWKEFASFKMQIQNTKVTCDLLGFVISVVNNKQRKKGNNILLIKVMLCTR